MIEVYELDQINKNVIKVKTKINICLDTFEYVFRIVML